MNANLMSKAAILAITLFAVAPVTAATASPALGASTACYVLYYQATGSASEREEYWIYDGAQWTRTHACPNSITGAMILPAPLDPGDKIIPGESWWHLETPGHLRLGSTAFEVLGGVAMTGEDVQFTYQATFCGVPIKEDKAWRTLSAAKTDAIDRLNGLMLVGIDTSMASCPKGGPN